LLLFIVIISLSVFVDKPINMRISAYVALVIAQRID